MANRPRKQDGQELTPASAKARPVVPVRFDGRTWGVPVEIALGVVALGPLAPVPLAPERVQGLHALRGRPALVINCSRERPSSVGLTVEYEGQLYTLMVDEVGEVETADLPPLDIAALLAP